MNPLKTGLKTAQSLAGKILPVKEIQRFGYGDPNKEKKLPSIHVFVRFRWTVNSEGLWRNLLASTATLHEVLRMLHELDPTLEDARLTDENGYEFHSALLKEPLWKFSNNGRLSLNVIDRNISPFQDLIKGAVHTSKL
eukprot:m.242452 g.242452  ORF g.242452 m.242452 type:complete len:138 (+) comp25696_c0_seq1:159-572(+)